MYKRQASVPQEIIDHEKSILASQMKEDPKMASKPEACLLYTSDEAENQPRLCSGGAGPSRRDLSGTSGGAGPSADRRVSR